MAKPKTDIQLILEYASKRDMQIIFLNDAETLGKYPGVTHIYNRKRKTLKILIGNLPIAYEEKIFQIIRDRFNAEGLILKRGQADELERYEKYKQKNKYGEIVAFFQDKIPATDLVALKMSFFMISEKEKGVEIHKYKKSIRERFGERGSIISNLCNAGYFEKEFMPLYDNQGKEEFEKQYELAVSRNARAIFVHSGMSFSYLYTAFLSMIGKCRKFSLPSFRVHAFGNQNVSLAKEVLIDLEANEPDQFTVHKNEKEHSYITCDIILK